jgi:hypothetical protein
MGGPPAWRVGEVLTNPRLKKWLVTIGYMKLGTVLILWNKLSSVKGTQDLIFGI